MGTLISLVAYVFAAIWLFDHSKDGFWWILLITLVISVVLMAVVQLGTPREARSSLIGHNAFASLAARSLLVPMGIVNVVLLLMVVYAYWSY